MDIPVGGSDKQDEAKTAPAPSMLPPRAASGPPELLANLCEAIIACDLKDGATLSFHHHLRDGDAVLNQVLDAAAEAGLRGLTIAASSIFPVHAPLVNHIATGVVTRLVCDYVKGPVASAIMAGLMPEPVLLQSHGGRARAISSGQLPIDIAFLGAPRVARDGAATGAGGRAPCGPLGYAMVDADYAKNVVLLTEEICTAQPDRYEIEPGKADFLVTVPSLGDNRRILSGATAIATDAASTTIVNLVLGVIQASGLVANGFSFQTGAGGISLGVANKLGHLLTTAGVKGGFVSGGIAGGHVALLEAGLFERILDVQCFDLEAVSSYERNPAHIAMSASRYASPIDPAPVVDLLDTVVLGATEVDRSFNVNVATGSNGVILGGPGGHPDTAAGAKLTIVTTRLKAGGNPKIVDRVACCVTPGCDVDVVVTEAGIAVNPMRMDLLDRFRRSSLPLRTIDQLAALAAPEAGVRRLNRSDSVVAIVERRGGGCMDAIYGCTA
ncbi:citrate lyase subunit alpha [Rhizobium leguminosarum bv. viciae]|uniref:citrate lyase subunit alpha n=1 Tax=Rhizobium leguminosarum TaxID=384 RepID=UPI001441CF2D|nr:citrate lyase subunit alpha [Rhizobium leguminosarum]NKK95757.1 citrate lyase subunit alpha [Rhizobium leguminosarum bv. viciae]